MEFEIQNNIIYIGAPEMVSYKPNKIYTNLYEKNHKTLMYKIIHEMERHSMFMFRKTQHCQNVSYSQIDL